MRPFIYPIPELFKKDSAWYNFFIRWTEDLRVELATTWETLTIDTGAITITKRRVYVDTESAASSDDLDTINGGEDGQIVVFAAANDARTVVMKDGTGNLKLAGDFSLDNDTDTMVLVKSGTNWLEISRSAN